MAKRNPGFTLLEVSMVIVIISLIMGSIVFATSLIRNAEMQNIYGEMEGHLTAIKTFQDKYQALPGDFSSASSIFSGVSNGNGNGIINSSMSTEPFYAWKHLLAAKLIEAYFSGWCPGGGMCLFEYCIPGTNIPTSQIATAGWSLKYVASSSADLLYTAGDTIPGHVLWFGGTCFNEGSDDKQMPVITPEEADLIDQKFDDGLPGTGKIVSQVSGLGTECHSSSSAYNLSVTTKVCGLVFKTGL